VLYSASVAPFLKSFSRGWKLLLSYLMADETYAIVINHYNQLPRGLPMSAHFKQWYFLGAGLTLWITWQVSTGVGIFVGALIPPSWALDFSLPLTFIAIVVPGLRDRAGWAAAIVAGVVSVLAFALPFQLSLVAATVLGIAVALVVESRLPAPARPTEAQT
jgi:predicted branched-subunit amino acid permease